MKPTVFKPERLDPARFAREAGRLDGSRAHQDFERLQALQWAASAEASVSWTAEGATRQAGGRTAEPWLHLQARTTLQLQCQRCLDRLAVAVQVDRQFRFVTDEARAEAEDADDDEADVLALGRALDLHELIEDELILALPLVPRHEDCALPAGLSLGGAPGADAADAAVDGTRATTTGGASARSADDADVGTDEGSGDTAGDGGSGRPNPFAVLAALRRRPS